MARLISRMPVSVIDQIVASILDAYRRRRSVFAYGNGGSAALASHCACDLGKGTAVPDQQRLRFMALTDNVPLITAWANDSAYQDIFVEQLRNFLQPGDISFAISCSGNSPNVLKALQYSRQVGATTIGIAGFRGGEMKDLCDVCLIVPSDNMQLIEDMHLAIAHAVFTAVRHRIREASVSGIAAVASF
ncbi:MAG: SIS domain-containing protein [Terriglobales bacterium]